MENIDKKLPLVFMLEIVWSNPCSDMDWSLERMPYYDVFRFQYICKNKRWLKENMEDNPVFDGRKILFYYITEYWSGYPMHLPAQKKLIKDYGLGIKRQIDKIDFFEEGEENKKAYLKLKKSRKFNPGDIVWFLYENKIYTGIIYGKFWESERPETATPNCYDIEKRTKFHTNLDTYTVMVLEHEDGPSFYYPDRLEIMEKCEDWIKEYGEMEYYEYMIKLRGVYDKLKGKLTPEGEPKEQEV